MLLRFKTMRESETEFLKRMFAGLNYFISERGGWLVSVPGERSSRRCSLVPCQRLASKAFPRRPAAFLATFTAYPKQQIVIRVDPLKTAITGHLGSDAVVANSSQSARKPHGFLATYRSCRDEVPSGVCRTSR